MYKFASSYGTSRRSDSKLTQKKMSWLHNVGNHSLAIIVDDTESVWDHAGNLILVEPYVYHVGGQDVNNAPGGGASRATKSRVEVSRPHPPPADPSAPPVDETHLYLLDVLRVGSSVCNLCAFVCPGLSASARRCCKVCMLLTSRSWMRQQLMLAPQNL